MFAEDLSVFINVNEFAVLANIDGVPTPVLFDNAYTRADFAQVSLAASSPSVLVKTASIGGAAPADITLGGIDYLVRATEPDGQGPGGLTRLVLEQVNATEAA